MSNLEWLFYASGFAAIYSYFIYPVVLSVLPKRSVSLPESKPALPKLSLIVTAHNEKSRIVEKIENTLKIDYPTDHLEIIIASDASTDGTDDIVRSYGGRGVKLVRAEERKGKENAQLKAIQAATGDILVFSDTATQITGDVLHKLVSYFNDPKVGALSSEDRFISEAGNVAGEGAYVKYEMWLRRLESQVAGLVGLSGSFFAARREICANWDIYSPSDFNTALNCARAGCIAVTAPDVLGYYKDLKDPRKEYQRKVRTVLRGITGLFRHLEVLNPIRFGVFAFEVWSHKVMRWAVPWFLVAFLTASLLLFADGWLFQLATYAQCLFYGLVLLGWTSPALRENTVIKIPFFFLQVNWAIAHATLLFMFGKRMTVWTPSQR